jgi:pimeloyl-ACP methyl ester carboxylesterase
VVSTDASFATRNDPLLVKSADGCPLPLRRFGPRDDEGAPAVLLLAGGDGAMRGWRALLPALCLDDAERALYAPLAPLESLDASLQVVVWDARGGGWAGRHGDVTAALVAEAEAGAAWGDELGAEGLHTQLATVWSAVVAGLDLDGRLGRLRAPTLVVHGGQDAVVPVSHADQLARQAGARRLVLEGGHLLPVEQAPRLASAIEAHVLAAETRPRGE